MRTAAAAKARGFARTDERIVLDLSGRRIELTVDEAEQLRSEGEREGGRSSVARDLSVLLGHAATTGQTLALRRIERETLSRIAERLGLHDLVARLAVPASGASRRLR